MKNDTSFKKKIYIEMKNLFPKQKNGLESRTNAFFLDLKNEKRKHLPKGSK